MRGLPLVPGRLPLLTLAHAALALVLATSALPARAVSAIVLTPGPVQDVLCFGAATGSASILEPTGGSAPYTYDWSPGTPMGDGTPAVSQLTSGTWTVTVTDNAGRMASLDLVVGGPTSAATPTVISITPESCTFDASGSITLSTTGGTPGYTFMWSNGRIEESMTGLPGGFYTLYLSDSNGCMSTHNFIVPLRTGPTVTPQVQPVACKGDPSGSVTLTVEGGTGASSVLWSNGSTTNSISNLPAGSYGYTVTDSDSCATTGSVTITEPTAALSVQTQHTDISCAGAADGLAAANPAGGTPGYTYLWSDGSTTASINGRAAGSYSATVTDAAGCMATAQAVISEPAPIKFLVLSDTPSICPNPGSINFRAQGGTGTLMLDVDPSSIMQDGSVSLMGPAGGMVEVTAVDANMCTSSQTFSFTDGNGANDAPTAADKHVNLPETTTSLIELETADLDCDALELRIVDQPQHGTLAIQGLAVEYQPASAGSFEDSFTYKAFDGELESSLAHVTITVGTPPDAGMVEADAGAVDAAVSGDDAGVADAAVSAPDAGQADAAAGDAGTPDATTPDAARPDANGSAVDSGNTTTADAGATQTMDAGASEADAGGSSGGDSQDQAMACACAASNSASHSGVALAGLMLAASRLSRRRRG